MTTEQTPIEVAQQSLHSVIRTAIENFNRETGLKVNSIEIRYEEIHNTACGTQIATHLITSYTLQP